MALKVTFALAALASIALAQNQTQAGQPTLTIPFGSTPSADGFAASVQSADGCKTTLVVGCAETSSPNELCQLATDLAATLVMNPTGYQVGYSYSTLGGSAVLSQSCSFEGPVTAATGGVCTLSISVGAAGYSTSVSTVATISSGDVVYARAPVTAGASNLPTGSAACSPTSDGGVAAPTNMVMSVVKVLVPVVAVAGVLI
ncbi:uncharacterized protein MYCGRDRAFT_108976 [Zymoseptoria tritici IPO323]|uniref:Uncharacterized protein n=1 Tax=Zymoseptoria tritici (strain CBS 115943 / IPO323) TaxID=336722 RepID=F9X8T1_ZYMTI|nr:uncharacterized protein MYCGRDRAFT_108976 [Zymoseptoria tritici IPO323]EGP87837.1 hypothetical protein MYCGRDRAFT_108976 [Zymoseptoria tritici IPO323]